ncbi:MAG TPA: PqqD family protein [Kiritimatiellia bacterium]|nr:PqqD family protein [Kiritimatiellia bacterium]
MKLKAHPALVERNLRNTCLLVPVMHTFEELDSLYSLNETAQLIWQGVRNGQDPHAIAESLSRTYDIDPEQATLDVQATLGELIDLGLLVPENWTGDAS